MLRTYTMLALTASLFAGCDSTPESTVRSCATDGDCAVFADTPYCDRAAAVCMAPCTGDRVRLYVCVDGRPMYCEDDMALPCTVCTDVCGVGMYCDEGTSSCAPQKDPGMPCVSANECTTSSCTASGVCGVEQGESCTSETCEGTCARGTDGSTYCIRRCSGRSCTESTAGGYTWYCIRFGYDTPAPAYCVPGERCIWEGSCSTFEDSTCGQACPPEGCYTYCVPDALETM